VQEFIHEHMHTAITLTDLARVAELHPTYFSDRFLKLVGLRPLEYLMRRRMERAQHLLLASTAPVKKVAGEVGLSDPLISRGVHEALRSIAFGLPRRPRPLTLPPPPCPRRKM